MRFSTLLALAALPLAAYAKASPQAQYLVQRALEPVVVDGKLDEFSWEQAHQINRFERILNDYDEVLFPTRAKMLWDGDYFYFAFVCQDADMWAIYDQEDDPMWSEEVVEVFIDPDGDGKRYLELEVNPLNAVVDLLIYSVSPEWHSSKDWDIAGLKTAVQAYGTVNDSLALDRGWTAEIAIPWAAMADSVTGGARPTAGDVWRLNLYRIERKGGRTLQGRIRDLQTQMAQLDSLDEQIPDLKATLSALGEHYHEQTEYTAWSETYQRGFHHPARFGAVQFAE